MSRKKLGVAPTLNPSLAAGNDVEDVIDDYAVLEEIKRGNIEKYRLLAKKYNQRLFRVTRSILMEDQLAMDAVQNAHLSAFKKLAKFSGTSGFPTWISTIARNEALMILRKNKSNVLLEQAEGQDALVQSINHSLDGHPSDPEAAFSNTQLRRLLNHYIDGLPIGLRETFVMRCVEGASVNETAELLNINAVTVKTRVFRAKALLQERITHKYGSLTYEIGGAHCDQITRGVMQQILAL